LFTNQEGLVVSSTAGSLSLGLRQAQAVNSSLRSGFGKRSFDSLRSLRTSPAGSDARKTAQYKTGAYSPPRFSAPVLKGLPKLGEPGRSSTFGQLVRRAEAGYAKSKKWDAKLRITKMPCAAEAGQ
jgi:hypothetical protein